MTTKVEWASHSWNPIIGCSPASEGCRSCYAASFATRHAGNPKTPSYHEIDGVAITKGGKWTGETRLIESKLAEPLRWRKPRARVFVGSMTDLFHPSTSFEDIASVYGVMACRPAHTFLVLTKRPERAAEFYEWAAEGIEAGLTRGWLQRDANGQDMSWNPIAFGGWPLRNVWLGISAENQKRYAERWPFLVDLPAAKRFVSYEPALGPIEFGYVLGNGIDWVIAGAERGNVKRIANLEWFLSARDQCAAASVPYFFKRCSRGKRELDGVRHEATP